MIVIDRYASNSVERRERKSDWARKRKTDKEGDQDTEW